MIVDRNKKTGMRFMLSMMMALAMSIALAGPQIPAVAATPSATFDNSSKGLLSLIEANRFENINMDTYGDVRMQQYIPNDNVDELYTVEAQRFQEKNSGDDVSYQLYDINKDGKNEMIITYPVKARKMADIYGYDSAANKVSLIKSLSGVSEIRKDTKKKQIVVLTSKGSKNYSYTAYKYDGTKIKKSTTWSRNKNTYKKNKKKITKKAFSKQKKSFSKMKKLSFKKIPATDFEDLRLFGVNYWAKDLCYNESYLGDELRTTIMQKDNTESQDKYLAYGFSYSRQKNGEYGSDPSSIVRYVFGPDVVNPQTGKTYLQQDWEQVRIGAFDRTYDYPLIYSVPEFGTSSLYEDEIENLEVKDVTLNNGEKTYQGKEYSISNLGHVIRYSFFSEGALLGRIAEVVVYDENDTDETPEVKYIYNYGTEGIENEPEWNPVISGCIVGKGPESFKNRKLTIPTVIDGKKGEYEIVVSDNVRFELVGNGSGEFVSYLDDGSEQGEGIVLPYDHNDKRTCELAESWLNPKSDKTGKRFGDSSYPRGIIWEPVNSVDLIDYFGQDVEKVKGAFPYMDYYEETMTEETLYIEYKDKAEYEDGNIALAGPVFTVNPLTKVVDSIEYSGSRHTVAGIRAGMTVKAATDKLKAAGWTFKEVTFSEIKAIPTLCYEKDGVTIKVLSNKELDYSDKSEDANTKKGIVYAVSVSK